MKTCSKVVLLAAGLAALLLLCSAPTAEASRAARTLSQWSNWGSTYQGWGWGPGWGFGPNPMDPVGSGCYDENGYRYRNGESQYCPGGGRRRCNWGEWEGECRANSGSSWDDNWDNSWNDSWNRKK